MIEMLTDNSINTPDKLEQQARLNSGWGYLFSPDKSSPVGRKYTQQSNPRLMIYEKSPSNISAKILSKKN